MHTSSDKTFVFDNVEVKLTGRIAEKVIKLSTKELKDILIEVQPVDSTGPQWKKWVKKVDLYEISDIRVD
jgi:hypothetical protein